MSENNKLLTIEVFENNNPESIIHDCQVKLCENYTQKFCDMKLETQKESNKEASELFSLFERITSFYLNLDSKEQPFFPALILIESRSAIPADLTDVELIFLQEIAPLIQDPELRARISDVVWVTKKDFHSALLAVPAYLESFQILLTPENWYSSLIRLERALQLAAMLGKKNTTYQNVIKLIERTLDTLDKNESSILANQLLELLLEQRVGNFNKYSELSREIARLAETNKNWALARIYWETSAKLYLMNKNESERRICLIAAAETYVKEAEDAIQSNSQIKYSHAAGLLINAIEASRRIGGLTNRIEDLHMELLSYQKKSVEELTEIASYSLDLTELRNKAIEEVKGKGLVDALISLAQMGASPKVGDLRQLVQNLIKDFPLSSIMTTIGVNQSGKIMETRPSLLSNDPERQEAAIKAEMYKHALLNQQVHAYGVIEPARTQIQLEHPIRTRDLLRFVTNNPFVPEGREEIYARGLYAGLTGDFLVSTHLLIPQLESSIRYILSNQGEIVSNLGDDRTQDEKNLNSLLFSPKLIEILGEDITFDLQGLLVERFGSNIRNDTAHGLINIYSFSSPQHSYLWWLVLRLCVFYKLLYLRSLQQGAEESNN